MNNSTGKGIAIAGMLIAAAYLQANRHDIFDGIYAGLMWGFAIVGYFRL